MTSQTLFNSINEYYGQSLRWESELADLLGISPKTASRLVQLAGYYRHKRISKVTADEFASKPYIKYVITKILP